jgi:hypothetical protein
VTLEARFSLLESEFNPFLFATIGDEANGVELTILSALTRLGFDPWLEADRLAKLPRTAAGVALAETLARLPNAAWDVTQNRAIAARLVELLPDTRPIKPSRPSSKPERTALGLRAAALILFLVVAAVAFLKS